MDKKIKEEFKVKAENLPEIKKDIYGFDDLDAYAQELIEFVVNKFFETIDATSKSDQRKKEIKEIMLKDTIFRCEEKLRKGKK